MRVLLVKMSMTGSPNPKEGPQDKGLLLKRGMYVPSLTLLFHSDDEHIE